MQRDVRETVYDMKPLISGLNLWKKLALLCCVLLVLQYIVLRQSGALMAVSVDRVLSGL